MVLFKYFALAATAVYVSQVTFGPSSLAKDLNIRGVWPSSLRFDSIADDNNS